jgi:hypothetical protein
MIIKLNKNGFMARRVMPLAQAIDNHRLKAFLAIYAVWLVDLASTAIALGFFSDVFYEGNPVADMFFSIGWIGWLGWMVVCAGLIGFLVYLPDIFLKIDIWIYGKKMKGARLKRNKNTYSLLRLMNIVLVIFVEGLVIIRNISNLIKVF